MTTQEEQWAEPEVELPSSPATPERIVEESTVVTVTSARLNVRQAPDGDVVKVVTEGTELEVLNADEEGWLETSEGYVRKEFTS